MKNVMRSIPTCVALAVCVLITGVASAQEIKNPDFAEWSGDKPASWRLRKNKQTVSKATDAGHETADTALQVELIADGGNSYGEILQELKLKPSTKYRVTADVRSTKGGLGIIQIKRLKGRKEVQRLNSKRSQRTWTTVTLEFDTGDADRVQLLCRYNQKAQNTGEKIWWTNLKIEELPADAESAE